MLHTTIVKRTNPCEQRINFTIHIHPVPTPDFFTIEYKAMFIHLKSSILCVHHTFRTIAHYQLTVVPVQHYDASGCLSICTIYL